MLPLLEGLTTLITNVVPLLWKHERRKTWSYFEESECRRAEKTLKESSLTCVDEFNVSLQVAVDHKHFVASGMGAGSLPHVLVMLFNVLLEKTFGKESVFSHKNGRTSV